MKKLLCIAILIICAGIASAATTPVDCSSASTVNTAISNASSGDTLQCSVGGTWTSDVDIPTTKYITLDLNEKTITVSGSGVQFIIRNHATGINRVTNGNLVRGSGFDPYTGPIQMTTTKGAQTLRLDNISFSGSNVILNSYGDGPALVDNCTFTAGAAQEAIHLYGSSWTDAYTPGSNDAIVFEDNTFNGAGSGANTSWSQAYYAARQMWRYNTFNWWSVDCHGTAGNVGCRWWDMYNNDFSTSGGNGIICLRAGSGIVFGNTNIYGFVMVEEDSGYPADYQIGRGQSQALYPAYAWDNEGNPGLNSGGTCSAAVANMVQLNRDVYYPTSGTSLPGSCSGESGYWKTDAGGNWDTTHGGANDGALYKCNGSTYDLYYTPLQYPHPARDESGDETAPTLSTFIVQTAGTTVISTFDEIVTESGTGGDWSFTMSGGAVTLSSPSVDGSAITYTTSRTINYDETLSSLSYTQPGDGIEDASDNDLATIPDASGEFTNSSLYGAFIDPDRITDWSNAGLTSIGGIPDRTSICDTLSQGATATQINSAIDSCSSGGGVVYLNAGTYTLTGPIYLKSNVTLRGAGMTDTVIQGEHAWHLVQFGQFPGAPVATSVTGSPAKGDTTITVGSVSTPLINTTTKRFIVIDQTDDNSEVSTTSQESDDYSDRSGRKLAEMVEVTEIDGTTLTIDPPLHHGFATAQTPQVWVVNQGIALVTLAGIEDLTINRTSGASGAGYNNVKIVASAYCWVKNVKSIRPDWWHVDLEQSFRCEIRHSYFDRGWGYSNPYYPYGVVAGYASCDNLIENNVFYHLRHSMVVKYGAMGNVYGYNYSLESIMDDSSYLSGDIQTHGGHNTFNLFEGNIVSKIHTDYTHGSSSYNTFFRNYVKGDSDALTTTAARYTVDADEWNTYNNYMANVLGVNSYSFSGGCETGSTRNVGYRYIWSFGFGSDGDSTRNSTLPESTAWRHGNWDYCNDSVAWEAASENHTVPDSYYLSSKPSFMVNLTWPNIDPTTPTIEDNAAKYFYDNGTWPSVPPNAIQGVTIN